jgi:hypothetical protein
MKSMRSYVGEEQAPKRVLGEALLRGPRLADLVKDCQANEKGVNYIAEPLRAETRFATKSSLSETEK